MLLILLYNKGCIGVVILDALKIKVLIFEKKKSVRNFRLCNILKAVYTQNYTQDYYAELYYTEQYWCCDLICLQNFSAYFQTQTKK